MEAQAENTPRDAMEKSGRWDWRACGGMEAWVTPLRLCFMGAGLTDVLPCVSFTLVSLFVILPHLTGSVYSGLIKTGQILLTIHIRGLRRIDDTL